MSYLNSTYKVLSTIQAAAADVSLQNNILSITGMGNMDVRQIRAVPGGIQPTVAEVLQITTVTPTAVASTVYELYIEQYVQSLGKVCSVVLRYTSAASGDTATTICDAWRAQLADDDGGLAITPSGTATLVLTAETGSPIFRVLENSASIAQSTGTAGVAAIGTYNALLAKGVAAADITSGKTYTTVIFDYNLTDGNVNANVEESNNLQTLYIQDDATNYAVFLIQLATYIGQIGQLGYIANQTLVGSTALTGAIVVGVTTWGSIFESLGAGTATLADGAVGQCMVLSMKIDGGDMVLTPANLTGGTTITFNDAGDVILLRFLGTTWRILANSGTTVA